MTVTTDPLDPRLGQSNNTPGQQNKVYLVLDDAEIGKGYVRPLRSTYKHAACGTITSMGHALAATYARDPAFYTSTYCVVCALHRPVAEFTWVADGLPVGS